MIVEKALNGQSPEYLDIPLVLDAQSGVVHTSIRDSRKYEQDKEARRLAEKIKVEPIGLAKFRAAASVAAALPDIIRDPQPQREPRHGPAATANAAVVPPREVQVHRRREAPHGPSPRLNADEAHPYAGSSLP